MSRDGILMKRWQLFSLCLRRKRLKQMVEGVSVVPMFNGIYEP